MDPQFCKVEKIVSLPFQNIISLLTRFKTWYFISEMTALAEAGDINVNDDQALVAYIRLLLVLPDLDFEFRQMP
jgi:hypothetical protein